ncbi:MAG: hypothetical protein HY327_10420 [Chloroflexi bacterium]|nr:hypothetical protein [Chloroflexota bacterium]
MNLATTLDQLENEQLIRTLDDAYLFKHALTQETAYQSLLRQTRREVHRLVAQAYETLFADQLDDYAAILARHYAETDEVAKTIEYETRAGDAAARVHAPLVALEHYTRALELVTRNGATARVAPTDVFLKKGRMLELAGRFDDALANYAAMETRGRDHGERGMELNALITSAIIRSNTSTVRDEKQADELSKRALALARELGDPAAEAKILWTLSLNNSFAGHPRESVEYGEQSIGIARALNLREQLAYSLNDVSFGYLYLGEIEKTRAVLDEARGLWRELDNPTMLSDNLIRASVVHYGLGEFQPLYELSEQSAAISEKIGNTWGQAEAVQQLGYIHFEYGEFEKAIHFYNHALESCQQSGHSGMLITTHLNLAWLYETLGALERAQELAHLALEETRAHNPSWEAWAQSFLVRVELGLGNVDGADARMQKAYAQVSREDFLTFVHVSVTYSEVALAQRDYERAHSITREAMNVLERAHLRLFLADALFIQARAWLAQNNFESARKALETARGIAEQQNSRRMLWKILAARAECESNEVRARTWRGKSRVVVEYIAAHSPPELRARFLNQTEIVRVMTQT